MHNYIKHLTLLGKRMLLLMLFLTLTRLVFYFVNQKLFAALSVPQVIMHFIYGLRFDLAALSLFNIVLVLFSVVPVVLLNKKGYQLFLKWLFYLVSIAMLALNMIDSKFFEFEGKRLSADYFSKEWLGNNTVSLLPEFLANYWYLFLLFAGFVFLFIKMYPAYKPMEQKTKTNRVLLYSLQSIIGLIVVFGFVILGRGGFQLKPIGVIAAARYTQPEYMGLVLNSPFTVVKTMGRYALPNPNYFDQEQLVKNFNPIHQYKAKKKVGRKNVVIIILESFSKEYSGFLNDTAGFTPNFDSIMQKGLTFKRAFANGKRSIDALPAILSSIPNIMDNAFITSLYNSNRIQSIGELLKSEGYASSFYHGGTNGTMGFDNFIKLAGIDKYFGLNEYGNLLDYDGNWGIFDEPYLQYYCHQLTQTPEPFFSSVFTLSSHHPYTIPEKYEGKFPKGDLVNLESIGYADFALGRFFEEAGKQAWFKNTLFVLTADHTAQANEPFYTGNVGKYAIPIVFYAPGDTSIHGVSDRVCQQTDIFPSVLDYLGYPKPFMAFGNSVFDKDSDGFAISYANGLYQFIYENYALHFNGTSLVSVDSLENNELYELAFLDSLPKAVNQGENLMKAYIQQFNIRMEKNTMKLDNND